VDLDGAKCGELKNSKVITDILKTVQIPCEVGGGLRTQKDIEYFLKQGARRVVLGTKVFEDRKYLEKLIPIFGEKIAVSVDFSGEKVAKKGWQEKTDLPVDAVISQMEKIGVQTIIITDISMDGTLMGPNIEKIKKILKSVNISVIASGGVSCIDDIKKLKAIGTKNLEGLIIGRALYEGKVSLEDAIKIVKE
jgi:phosphoribosylformimino-5-aminoimidazole carboxamide ribotide isomerase